MSIYRGAGGSGDAVADSSSEALLVRELAVEVQADADAAAASATSASGSASAASTSATNAANSATAAASSATSASTSASTASTAATNAQTAETNAETAQTAAELAETNAETAETNAETAATNAASSASAASTSATNASNSATAAATSATNASNSATAAATSATNAGTSATSAAGSASTATTQASNASTSATNAASSATSAAGSATTATTQAGIATTQATNAASSASAAATSATNAASSATAAAGSATSASDSATTATTQATNAANSASAAATSATSAASSATSAATSAAAASAVALGNEPVRHSVRPSLLLDFANTKTLDPRITFTRGSTATYFDDKGVMQTAAAGVARFDHNPTTGESLGLLIEEQRTNLLTYSEQFDNAAWTSKLNTTVSANAIIAPDGTLTGDKLVASSGSSTKYLDRAVTVAASTTHTFSAYMKAGEYTTATIYAIAPSAPFENFSADVNLTTGTVSNIVASNGATVVTATATSVGNGWWRVSLIGGVSTKTSLNTRIYPNISTAFTGDGTSGIYLWGAQLEAGSFATSYIPTTSAQVTRSADSASMTGTNFSSWYRADEGTIYNEAIPSVLGAYRISSISDGTSFNRFLLNAGISIGDAVISYAGSIVANPYSGATAIGAPIKQALAYKVNDFAFSGSGASVATDTLGAVPMVNQLHIGAGQGGAISLNGTIKKFAYYPKRLTNAELQGLSTV